MKQSSVLSAIAVACILTSCGYTASDNSTTGKVTPPAGAAVFPVLNTDSTVQAQSAQQAQPQNQITVAQNPGTVVNTSSAVGLNPAHGQPGHRCDLAVGAPLNSTPAAQAPPTTQAVQTAPTIQPTAAASNPVAAGLNPAHGQPGHRCDLAVGAPLNSKPAPAATTNTNNPVTPLQVTPVAANATTDAAGPTKAGMNPAHGQPGHRCDVAVGAPLPADSTKKQ